MHYLDFKSYNRSWLSGFIKENFPNYLFLDSYLNHNDKNIISDQCIVYLDDEEPSTYQFLIENLEYLNKDIILICKIKEVCDKLSSIGYRCLYYPYWHIVDDAIAVKKLSKLINLSLKNDLKYSFCCLNRNQTPWRDYLIEELINLDLINYGYVTYINSNKEYKGIRLQPHMEHYIACDYGFERHNHYFKDIGYSSNVANYYYIQENINAPINISMETTMKPWFPTEKSFLSFFTKKIPIVLAEPNRITDLESEGFDIFKDYVNHRYDNNYYSPESQIKQALVENRDLLINFNDDVSERTNKNFDFLINQWLDNKLTELINGVKKLR